MIDTLVILKSSLFTLGKLQTNKWLWLYNPTISDIGGQ
jgi:hypothetical protein